MRRIVLAFVLTLVAVPAQAQPTPVQEYRQHLMDGLDVHFSAARAIVGADVAFDGHLADHARSIQAIAAMMVDVFPEGSQNGTRASEDIWSEWDDFLMKVRDLEAAGAALASAAESGDATAIAEATDGVGAACRSCHQPYRLRRGG